MLDYLISEEELADWLRKSKSTLVAWRQRGQGPSWLKLVGRIYYDRRKVDEWIAAQERTPDEMNA